MVSVNLSVDPANILSGIEREIAEILLAGNHVTGITNINDRSLKRQLINRGIDSDISVVLGSSRVLLIGKEHCRNNVLNTGVSGATINDLIGLYQLVSERHNKNAFVKNIVIGVDPWLFTDTRNQKRWFSLKAEVNRFHHRKNRKFSYNQIFAFKQFVSPTYLQASIKYLKNSDRKSKPRFNVTHQSDNTAFTYHPDGTISYSMNFRNVTTNIVNQRAIKAITDTDSVLNCLAGVTLSETANFEKLIQAIADDGFPIHFVLMPFHPLVYSHIESQLSGPGMKELEKYLHEFEDTYSVIISGSYSPHIEDLEPDDFYDGTHLNHSGLAKILKNIGSHAL